MQPIVATSSTETEFYAAVTCAKAAKYLRYVLTEMDAVRPGATPLLVDNEAAIAMVNESRPTPRARHVVTRVRVWNSPGTRKKRSRLEIVTRRETPETPALRAQTFPLCRSVGTLFLTIVYVKQLRVGGCDSTIFQVRRILRIS